MDVATACMLTAFRAWCAVSADSTARVWDLEIGDCMLLLEGHGGPITDMVVSNSGAYLATASMDGTARVWELERGECLFVLSGHRGPVNGVAMDAEAHIAITVSSDGTARTWDLTNGQCRHVLQHGSQGGFQTVSRVAFAPNNQTAITTGEDFLGRVWQVVTGLCVGVLTGHTGWVVDVAVTPYGQHCITASHDFTAMCALPASPFPCNSVCLSQRKVSSCLSTFNPSASISVCSGCNKGASSPFSSPQLVWAVHFVTRVLCQRFHMSKASLCKSVTCVGRALLTNSKGYSIGHK